MTHNVYIRVIRRVKMSIGANIKELREERKLTQNQVADALGITFQAVSAWERDEYKPDTDKLVKLAEYFGVSVSAIAEEKHGAFKTKDAIYDWEHMKTYVKTTAKNFKLSDSLKAVDFAVKAHTGQNRKCSNVPYIYHPLNLACHALSMDIIDDAVIAACLLHDVVEDTETTLDEVKSQFGSDTKGKNRDEVMIAYYNQIATNPKAALIKCMDRCNNLTTMSWGLSREKIFRMINETERYYPDLIKVIKYTTEYNNAAWLLKYQIESMLDIYKRLL